MAAKPIKVLKLHVVGGKCDALGEDNRAHGWENDELKGLHRSLARGLHKVGRKTFATGSGVKFQVRYDIYYLRRVL